MAHNPINKQIEDLKSSISKNETVEKIKSILRTEIDIEKLKNALTKTKEKNSKHIKKLQPKARQRNSYQTHTHTHPHLRRNGTASNIELGLSDNTDMHSRKKTTLTYIRYLTFTFVVLTVIVMLLIIITQNKRNGKAIANPALNVKNRADELTGIDQLRLLTLKVGESMGSIFSLLVSALITTKRPTNAEYDFDEYSNISIIQSIDSSTIFLKESADNRIHFVPFRKPLDSWCSTKDFSFQTECINLHNVRDVKYNSKTKELTFLISGSYPRLIEVNKDSIVILNDRVFGLSNDQKSFEEVTNHDYYQNGQRYCEDNVHFIKNHNKNEGNKIKVSGHCYGLLYLPKANLVKQQSIQLLSSAWSSIIIDSHMHVNNLILASNNEASIIFRSQLNVLNNLNIALSDASYVEFKEIRYANYISMITLQGSMIYIPSLAQCKIIDFAARNHSLIEIANIAHVNDIHLSISHFSIVKIPHMADTTLTYKRDKNTQLLLPKPHNYAQDSNLSISFP